MLKNIARQLSKTDKYFNYCKKLFKFLGFGYKKTREKSQGFKGKLKLR